MSEEYRTMSRLGPLAFDATSVTLIEAAAGLAAGSGAPYHHFRSKEPRLDAVATAFAAVLPARFRTGRTWYAQWPTTGRT